MKVPLITDFLKQRARRRLRRVMRGYRVLRATSQLDNIGALHSALTTRALELPAARFSARVLGAATSRAEFAVRQYLLARVGGLSLTKSILFAAGSGSMRVVHPLPAVWRRALRDRGIDVDGPRSAMLWFGLVVVFFLHGALTACKLVLDGFGSVAKRPAALGRYAHFDGLGPGNLPRPCRDGRSHDIVSWYMQWDGRSPTLDALTHTVAGAGPSVVGRTPLVHVSAAISAPPGVRASLRLLAWTVAATLIAAWDLLRGRWWHALLIREAARAAAVRLQDPGRLARDYLFSNSGWIYRPLWTYEAERAGSRALFYFYSTNSEAFKDARGYPDIIYGYRAMSWSRYLVWDKYQADFVRRCVGEDADISVVGPIWFQSSPAEIDGSRTRAVAVFDVQPHRESSYRSLGIATEYYVPRVACRFLLDIHAALTACGGDMVLKRKREIGRTLHPRYRNVVEALGRAGGFTAVDPAISALRVIETCTAVISMPFTSTALLGRQLGKPSVYYDPFGIARNDDRAAHGIEVLSGPDELRAWLARVLGSTEVTARLVQPANRSRG